MEKILDFIKTNIIKILIIIILVVLIIVGIFIYLEVKKKEYRLVQIDSYNYYVVNKGEKYGVIDTSGNIIIEALYDNVKIPNPEKPVFICEKDGKNTVINNNKEEIFTEYDEVTPISIKGIVSNIPYEKEVLRYKQNEKYGLINYEGKKITNAVYEEINGLENKESELIIKKDGKYGVINDKGANIIKPEYDNIIADGFYNELNKYGKSGYIVTNKTVSGYRSGYINYKRNKILDVEYNEISRIQSIENPEDVYLIASKNGKYGVQKNKKVLINFSYQGINYSSSNKIFELQRNSKFGIYSIYGNEIIPIDYDEIEEKGTNLIARKEEEIFYFDTYGNKMEDSNYTALISAGKYYFITINSDGLYGVIGKQKQELIPNKYNYIEYLFGENFIASNEEGNLGIIDVKDNVIVEFKYDVLQKIEDTNIVEGKILKESASDLYSEGLKEINSSTNISVYKEDEYIVVYSNDGTKYFDIDGNELTSRNIFSNNTLFAVEKDGKWGYEDKNSKIIIDLQYDKVTEFNKYGFAGIKKDDKWGIINKEGQVIVEPIYKIEEANRDPEFLGEFYRVYYGYGEIYYTNNINE